mgnify:CR=1 FL=1
MHTKRMVRTRVLLMSVVVSALVSGCVAVGAGIVAGAGVGTYYWVKGELKRAYAAEFDHAWRAAEDAGKELELMRDRYTRDKLGGEMAFIRGDGTEVTVRLRSKQVDLTEISVRIGTFGDRVASERIHSTIFRLLKERGQIRTGTSS